MKIISKVINLLLDSYFIHCDFSQIFKIILMAKGEVV